MCKTPARLAFAASAATLALATAAEAQSRCGASYVIEPGETLYEISQTCRVGLTRIMELNPDLNPRDIPVGARIALTGEVPQRDRDTGGGQRDRRAEGGTYTVREGDTARDIARAFGVGVMELLAENEDLEPFSMAVGEVLDLPTGDRSATVSVTPASGAPGSEVTLRARNLRPEDYVTLGVGRSSAEWRRLRETQVAADGEVTADVRVPRWADPGDVLTYVVDTDRGFTFKSGDFEVVAREGAGGRMSLEGRVRRGVECRTLTTPDGDVYSLVSDRVGLTPGEYVEIEGRRAGASFCQEGRATVEVTSIREVAPPRDEAGMTLEGRVRQGVECKTLTTPDGDVYSLVSDDIPLTAGEYVEVRGSRADMSFCQQGRATVEVRQIREVSPPGGQ